MVGNKGNTTLSTNQIIKNYPGPHSSFQIKIKVYPGRQRTEWFESQTNTREVNLNMLLTGLVVD
jgi:hypothetical protein